MSEYPSRRSVFGLGELLVVGIGVLLASSVLANRPEAPVPAASTEASPTDCFLEFSPSEARAGSDSMTVRATPSEEILEPDHALVEDDSGLGVALVIDHDPTHYIAVDPAEAADGEWTITLRHGELDLCSGGFLVWSPHEDTTSAHPAPR